MKPVESDMYILLNKRAKELKERREILEIQITALEERYRSTRSFSVKDIIDSMYEERSTIVEQEAEIHHKLTITNSSMSEGIAEYDSKFKKLRMEIAYLERSTKNPSLNRESREAAAAILEEKKAELALLEAEYNEKSNKIVEFVNGEPEEEKVKKIRKEIEDLYNLVMKIKYYVPGYSFSNEEKYNDLEFLMDAYNIDDLDLIFKMSVLEDDIKTINAEVTNPTMTKEEKELYYTLSGIVWTMAVAKEDNPNYIYTNVKQAESLLAEFERLKTKNPNIMEMIYIITKDIKKFKEKTEGKEAADTYQKKLDDLKIKSPLADTPDIDTLGDKIEDITKPGKKGIKDRRTPSEAEKAAASASKKVAKGNGVKLLSYVLPTIMTFGPGFFPVIGIPILVYKIIKDIRNGSWSNTFTNFKNSILNIGPSIKNWYNSNKEKHDIRKDKREQRKAERTLRRENIRAINRGISSNPAGDLVDDEPIEDSIEEPTTGHTRGGM